MSTEEYSFEVRSLHGSEFTASVSLRGSTSCHVAVKKRDSAAHVLVLFFTAMLSSVGLPVLLTLLWLTNSESSVWMASSLAACTLLIPLVYYHFLDLSEEVVSVVNGLGVIVSRRYGTGRTVNHFIEQSRVVDIIINEGLTMYKVVFYMAVLVKPSSSQRGAKQDFGNHLDSLQLVPLFMSSMPNLKGLKEIYQALHKIVHPT